MEQLAPNLMKFVKPAAKNLTVAMALQEDRWVTEIRGSLSIPATVEFMEIWELVRGLNLQDMMML
jgi:hypothetical protein